MRKKNVSICWRTIQWVTLSLGLLISIGGLFVDVLVSFTVTNILRIDNPLIVSKFFRVQFLQRTMILAGISSIILSILVYKYIQKKHGQSLNLEIEYDFKKLIVSSCVLVGLIIFLFSIGIQLLYVEKLQYTMRGLSDDQKREVLFGDFYKFIESCSDQIPETDNILLLNGSPFSNYYLYPRKIYRYPNSSLSLENISKDWLDERGIKWALSYNYTNFSLNESKIIKIR